MPGERPLQAFLLDQNRSERREDKAMTYESPELVEIGTAEDLVQVTEMPDQVEGGSIPDYYGW